MAWRGSARRADACGDHRSRSSGDRDASAGVSRGSRAVRFERARLRIGGGRDRMPDRNRSLAPASRAGVAHESAGHSMEKNVDRLSAALRDVARADAAQAPERLDPRVLRELFRPPSQAERATTRQGRAIGLAIAATLAAALAGSLWFVVRPPEVGRGGRAARHEVVTAFMPLTYSAVPYTDAQIVRLEVPRNALKNFGLAPADVPAD